MLTPHQSKTDGPFWGVEDAGDCSCSFAVGAQGVAHRRHVPSVGDTLRANGERAGTITSVLDTPEGSIGLALVRRQHLEAETLDGSDGQTMHMNPLPVDQRPAVG